MRAAVAGFLIGVVWLQQQASLPDFLFLFGLSLLALLAGVMSRGFKRVNSKAFVRMVCGVLFGVVWTSLFAHFYLAQTLPPEWEGRDVTLIGTVDSLPHRFDRGIRFNFVVEQAKSGEVTVSAIPSRVALSWYTGFGSKPSQFHPEVHAGERWQLTVRLKRPHGNANPYGFDYEAWLLGQQLRATGYVRPDKKLQHKNQRLDPFVFSVGSAMGRVRGWLRDRIYAALPDKPYAGVIAALVMGDQRAIRQSDWEVFRRTGISHLFAISGLHITMFAGLAAAIVLALWRRSFFTRAQLPLMLPAQKAAALAGAGAALIYVGLSGFGVPAQRTLYMLLVVAAALWFGRITRISYVLCLALGVTALLDPWAVLWPGFWLSFGAVAVILYATVGRAANFRADGVTLGGRWRQRLKIACMTQYAVTLGLVPLTMLLFGQVSLVSPIANAFAIPLVSLLVTPLALIGSVLPNPLVGWVLSFVHFLIEGLGSVLGWLSTFSFAVWQAPMPAIWIVLLALSGTLWMLAPRGWPSRWLGVFCWLPLFINAPTHPKAGEMWVTVFDVGQGSSLLIETEKHRMLVDAGPTYSKQSDAGLRVILPYLKGRGINTLDRMLVTHTDRDHAGGVSSILNEIRVASIWSSAQKDSLVAKAAKSFRRCEAGQRWTWDGVQFEMMHPEAASYASSKWKSNDRSCVLKIQTSAHSILLPGDIGWVQEDELINSQGVKLKSSVLLAPHHGGSKTSTSEFLQTVKPELGLFQVGYRNRYGHPRPKVLARYKQLGIQTMRTDQSGAILLRFGRDMEFIEHRVQHARYWNQR